MRALLFVGWALWACHKPKPITEPTPKGPPNATRAGALFLTKGAPQEGRFGCHEERFYTMQVQRAEEVKLILAAQPLENNNGAFLSATIEDSGGNELFVNDEPLAVKGTFTNRDAPDTQELSYVFVIPGTYYLHLRNGPTCQQVQFSISY